MLGPVSASFPLATALGVSGAVALLAWRLQALTAGGALAAASVGSVILLGTGWHGAAVLAVFFVSSSTVSFLHPAPATDLLDAKGNRRDGWQVYANGGPAAVGALVGLLVPRLGLWLVTCSLASAAADTWATSWGAQSPRLPRHVLTGQPVPAGTSGGITVRGCVGGVAGAVLVAGAGAITGAMGPLFPVAALIGFMGMLADSVIGAAWQGRFRCPACHRATERRTHRCGAVAAHTGGLPWLDNDGVNLLAVSLAALGGWAAWLLHSPS